MEKGKVKYMVTWKIKTQALKEKYNIIPPNYRKQSVIC